jgi:hypothetical protein
MCVYVCICIHTQTVILNLLAYTCMHTYIHTHAHTESCNSTASHPSLLTSSTGSETHVYTHTHTYIHIDTYTHIPTYIHRKLQFDGIPSFPPELFNWIRNPNPSKQKNFKKGIDQLREEGAMQVLYSLSDFDMDPILAAVGALQFEVTFVCIYTYMYTYLCISEVC